MVEENEFGKRSCGIMHGAIDHSSHMPPSPSLVHLLRNGSDSAMTSEMQSSLQNWEVDTKLISQELLLLPKCHLHHLEHFFTMPQSWTHRRRTQR